MTGFLWTHVNQRIRPGKTGEFGNVIPGKYDMLAGNCSQQYYQFLQFLRSL